MNTTYNYENLTDSVKTKEQAFALASSTFHPSVVIERTAALLQRFMEDYLENSEGKELLAAEITQRPYMITSLIETIYEQIKEVEAMLIECQEFKVEDKLPKSKIPTVAQALGITA